METTCPICFEDLEGKVKASPNTCDHVFCLSCLEKWAKLGSFCPVDRKRFKKIVNLESENLIQVKPRKRKRTKTFYDFSAKCEVCSKDSHANVLLLCDCCDLAFHLFCLNPPLEAVPAGLWFCPTCISVEAKIKQKCGITKEVEADLGNANLQLEERHSDVKTILTTGKNVGSINAEQCANSVETCFNASSEFQDLNVESKCCSYEDKKIAKTYRKREVKQREISKIHSPDQMYKVWNGKPENTNIIDLNTSKEVSILDDGLSQAVVYGEMKIDIKEEDADYECETEIDSDVKDNDKQKRKNKKLYSKKKYVHNKDWELSFNSRFRKKVHEISSPNKESSQHHSMTIQDNSHNSSTNSDIFFKQRIPENTMPVGMSSNGNDILPSCSSILAESNKEGNSSKRKRRLSHTLCHQPRDGSEYNTLTNTGSNKKHNTRAVQSDEALNFRNNHFFFNFCAYNLTKPKLSSNGCVINTSKREKTYHRKNSFKRSIKSESFESLESSAYDKEFATGTSQNLDSSGSSDLNKTFYHSDLKHLTVRSDGTFFLDCPTSKDQNCKKPDGIDSLKSSTYNKQFLTDALQKLDSSDNSVKSKTICRSDLKHLTVRSDGTFFLDCPTSEYQNSKKPGRNDSLKSSTYNKQFSTDALQKLDSSGNSVESKTICRSDLKHLTVRSDGTFFLDCPTSEYQNCKKPGRNHSLKSSTYNKPFSTDALQKLDSSGNSVESKTICRSDLKHLTVRSDGTFFLDCPSSEDQKCKKTGGFDASKSFAYEKELVRDTLQKSDSSHSLNESKTIYNSDPSHLIPRNEGNSFVDHPTSKDIKREDEPVQSSDASNHPCEDRTLCHTDSNSTIVKSDGTFFLDCPSSENQKCKNTGGFDSLKSSAYGKELVRDILQKSDSSHSLNESKTIYHSDPSHLIPRNEGNSTLDYPMSKDIEREDEPVKSSDASDNPCEDRTLCHTDSNSTIVKGDGTFFLDCPSSENQKCKNTGGFDSLKSSAYDKELVRDTLQKSDSSHSLNESKTIYHSDPSHLIPRSEGNSTLDYPTSKDIECEDEPVQSSDASNNPCEDRTLCHTDSNSTIVKGDGTFFLDCPSSENQKFKNTGGFDSLKSSVYDKELVRDTLQKSDSSQSLNESKTLYHSDPSHLIPRNEGNSTLDYPISKDIEREDEPVHSSDASNNPCEDRTLCHTDSNSTIVKGDGTFFLDCPSSENQKCKNTGGFDSLKSSAYDKELVRDTLQKSDSSHSLNESKTIYHSDPSHLIPSNDGNSTLDYPMSKDIEHEDEPVQSSDASNNPCEDRTLCHTDSNSTIVKGDGTFFLDCSSSENQKCKNTGGFDSLKSSAYDKELVRDTLQKSDSSHSLNESKTIYHSDPSHLIPSNDGNSTLDYPMSKDIEHEDEPVQSSDASNNPCEDRTLCHTDSNSTIVKSDGTFFLDCPSSENQKCKNTGGFDSLKSSAYDKELVRDTLQKSDSSHSLNESKTIYHSDPSHLIPSNDGNCTLDYPMSKDIEHEDEPVQSSDASNNPCEDRTLCHTDSNSTIVKGDGTFFLDCPSSENQKCKNTGGFDSLKSSAYDKELVRDTLQKSDSSHSLNESKTVYHSDPSHLIPRNEGNSTLDYPTSKDIECEDKPVQNSDASNNSCEDRTLCHTDSNSTIVKSDGTFFLDCPLSENQKCKNTGGFDSLKSSAYGKELVRDTLQKLDSSHSLNESKTIYHSDPSHLIPRNEGNSTLDCPTSKDIEHEDEPVQRSDASNNPCESRSVCRNDLNFLTIRSDGTFFLDIPEEYFT